MSGQIKQAGGSPFVTAADDAMVRFVLEYGELTGHLLRRYGVRDADLADARQEVLIVAWRKLAELREPPAVRAWLRTVCRRTAKDARRRASARHERLERLPGTTPEPADEACQDAQLDARARLRVVQQAAVSLSPQQREAWLAYSVAGEDAETIAGRMGCAPKTIFSRLYAARARMRERLAQSGLLSWCPGFGPAGQELGWSGSASGSSALGVHAWTGAVLAGVLVVAPLPEHGQPQAARLLEVGPVGQAGQVDQAEQGAPMTGDAHVTVGPFVQRASSGRPDDGVPTVLPDPEPPVLTMEFDVFDLAEPSVALSHRRISLLEFEPDFVPRGASSLAAHTTQPRSHSPDPLLAPVRPRVKPKLVGRFRYGHKL
ncbi:MAG: sigma-70 family RNA polymerase sigma factor [Myxococcales bacterium]|nr:sigma-70 family RNA polymerase sigma factor [Myxococcales bacterium]